MRKLNFMVNAFAVFIAISVMFIFIDVSTADLNDGLVAYYPFNGNANDESGNGNNCSVFGATLIKDKFGIPNSAYSFDGNDDYMNCSADATFNLNQEITVSAWVKLRSFLGAVIASKWKTRSGWSGSWFLMANIAPHFPGFGVAADGWNPTELTSNVPIELDTYNHIVGVYSITDNMLRIYVNGKEEGTAAGPGGLAISNSDVLIGAFRYTITSGRIERYINGILDDVRIYNRALSKSEILELYSKTLFVDVPPGHWAEESIYKIYEAGITTGCSQNPLKYCPQADVTRAQMAAFIVRAEEGEPDANYCGSGSPFSDVDPNHWACKYIKRLSELGITTGCGGGKYCPNDTVTRAQMAAFLVRAVEGEPPANYCVTGSPFSDVPPDHWACKYIKRLSELGITTGCGGGKYCPNDTVTRAQMAAFLARAFLEME